MRRLMRREVGGGGPRAGFVEYVEIGERDVVVTRRESGLAIARIEGEIEHGRAIFGGVGSDRITAALLALAEGDARGVLLDMHSPGGTVCGLSDIAEAAAALAKAKPLYTIAHDMMASGAYFLGVFGARVYATPMAMVGSIGAMQPVYDESGAFEKMGVRVVDAATGALKGIGVPGSAITPEQEAHLRAQTAALMDVFAATVMVRRPALSRAAIEEMQGGCYAASAALGRGLIDAVMGFDEAVREIEAMMRGQGTTRAPAARTKGQAMTIDVTTMSDEQLAQAQAEAAARMARAQEAEPDDEEEKEDKAQGNTKAEAQTKAQEGEKKDDDMKAATAGELKAAGIEGAFALECLAKNLSMSAAAAAYIAHLKAAPMRGGHGARGHGQSGGEAAAPTNYEAAVKAHVKAGLKPGAAYAKAANEHPDLHRQWLRGGAKRVA